MGIDNRKELDSYMYKVEVILKILGDEDQDDQENEQIPITDIREAIDGLLQGNATDANLTSKNDEVNQDLIDKWQF